MTKKVLVAHGNTQDLKQAVEDLQQAGFIVTATPDGGDAFARFFEDEPDLVICNQSLPGLSGINFGNMVASQSPDTPIVILTDGESEPGLEDFITISNPLNIEELGEAIPDTMPEPLPEFNDELLQEIKSQSSNQVFTLAALQRFQRDSAFLSLLDREGLERMAECAAHALFGDNECIIKQGDISDGFYLVVEGQVRVTLEEKKNEEIARISAGGFFGEMALLSNQPRSASVWSVGSTTLFYFDKEEFMPLLDDYIALRELLSGVAIKRTEENLWRVLFDDSDIDKSLDALDSTEDAQSPFTNTAGMADSDAFDVRPSSAAIYEPHPGPTPQASIHGHTEQAVTRKQLRFYMLMALIVGLVGGSASSGIAVFFLLQDRDPSVATLAPLSLDSEQDQTTDNEVPSTEEKQQQAQKLEQEQEPQEPALVAPTTVDAETEAEIKTVKHEAKQPQQTDTALNITAEHKQPKEQPSTQKKFSPIDPKTPRKNIRRAFMAAYKENDFQKAVHFGKALQTIYKLDWETQFLFAESLRQTSQDLANALELYIAFVKQYPTNIYADDALYRAGQILKNQGKTKKAKNFFKQVSQMEKSDFKNAALDELQ